MTPTQAKMFETWAPQLGTWSAWAKAVLFAHVPGIAPSPAAPMEVDAPWAPAADGRTAIVLDLPGPRSVWSGVALARRGYRPVPLFNAVPGPSRSFGPIGTAGRELVDVWSIIDALQQVTPVLDSMSRSLSTDAPPAFLLDAGRRFSRFLAHPGDFDNRSVSLPTDFPSANLLLNRGIDRALLVTTNDLRPQEDLAHALLRWQEAGIGIVGIAVDAAMQEPQPIRVQRPQFFRVMWHNLLSRVGLKRSPMGGFGGTLPVPSSG